MSDDKPATKPETVRHEIHDTTEWVLKRSAAGVEDGSLSPQTASLLRQAVEDAKRGEEVMIGPRENLLLLLAALATSAALFQIFSRYGKLGSAMQGVAVRYSRIKVTITLASLLWAAWYALAAR